jgi:hypothetical protein
MFKAIRRLFRRPDMEAWLKDIETIPDISGTWKQAERETFNRRDQEGYKRTRPLNRRMTIVQSDDRRSFQGSFETTGFRFEIVGHYAGRSRSNAPIFGYTLERIFKDDERRRLLHSGIMTSLGKSGLEMTILTTDGSKLTEDDPFPDFIEMTKWHRQPPKPAPTNG